MINDVAKIERDKAAEAKTDVVAESKTGEVPQECGSETNVEQSTEAPQQTQPSQQPSSGTYDPGTSGQRTAEQVVDVPVATEAGAGVHAAYASNASAFASWSRPNGASSAPESARLSDSDKLLQTAFLSN